MIPETSYSGNGARAKFGASGNSENCPIVHSKASGNAEANGAAAYTLLLGIDALLDMGQTCLNVTGDLV